MATQNYGAKSLAVLDKPFLTKSKTEMIINKGVQLTFEGVNTVTIYTPQTVDEVDYARDGANRFGPLVELPNSVQTFTLTQDKAATWTIDRGNYNDSMMAINAKNSMALQIAKVAVPNTDKYRFTTLMAYAVARTQGATAATTAANIFEKFLDQQALMTDAEVPEEGRVAFFTAVSINKLKRSTEYKVAADKAYADVKSGTVSMVDGTRIVVVPSSYLPANTTFLIVHEETLIAPVKMKLARTLDEVQGIDGWVNEYRRYHDAFITANKGVAIRYHKEA
jgi:hypothetical protein